MLSLKEALSDEPLKITTKKINFSLKKFTKSRRRGLGGWEDEGDEGDGGDGGDNKEQRTNDCHPTPFG
ncbi:hypothetical protein MC7420_2585 [Coleofasciculus chthonoplastes PCC 7420]|uniref:Uncharacterized protein n=1 Tax=Coleofasciculus chthonoplastes PCC 7420 TaxID=118168 RepID=B4VYP1_9CYAN|nr:hypothetical protein MC7420_2585 [Coleofasciculus chthonoplastes PCC 7420]